MITKTCQLTTHLLSLVLHHDILDLLQEEEEICKLWPVNKTDDLCNFGNKC